MMYKPIKQFLWVRGLDDYPLDGPAYGAEYVKIDTPEALQGEGYSVDIYIF